MITDYEFQNLIELLKSQVNSTIAINANYLTNIAIENLSDEQKRLLSEAYFNGIIYKLNTGQFFNKEIETFFTTSEYLKNSFEENSSKIKELVGLKVKQIMENIEKEHKYIDIFEYFKFELKPYIKKYIQEMMGGDNKIIINDSLKIITESFIKLSIKDYASKLFEKAQKIINDEIIKEIIE